MIRTIRLSKRLSLSEAATLSGLTEFDCAKIERESLRVPLTSLHIYLQAIGADAHETQEALDFLDRAILKQHFSQTISNTTEPIVDDNVRRFETEFVKDEIKKESKMIGDDESPRTI